MKLEIKESNNLEKYYDEALYIHSYYKKFLKNTRKPVKNYTKNMRNSIIILTLAIIYFIYAGVCVLTCFLFNDFGDEHIIIEESDIELRKFKIKNIDKNENNGKVKIFLADNENGLFNGCFVKFRDIQGMKELNYEKEKIFRKIKCSDNGKNIFFIGDISNYSDYESGGIVEDLNAPIKMNHQNFEKRLEEPIDLIKKSEMKSYILINSYQIFNEDEKLKRPENELIFLSFKSIFEFLDEKKRIPKLNSTEDEEIIIQKTKQLFEKEKN